MSGPTLPDVPGLVGAFLGALLGLGAWLTVRGACMGRGGVDLVDRLAPYLRDADPSLRDADPSGRRHRDQAGWQGLGPVRRLLTTIAAGATRRFERLTGSSGSLQDKLRRSGSTIGIDEYRAEQVLWGAVGLGAASAAAVGIGLARGTASVPLLVLVLAGGLAGLLARDQHLSRQVRQREDRMIQELPTVAELLALSVAAGESAPSALSRVAATTQGELAAALGTALAEARAGAPLALALASLSRRTGVPPVARFVDGVVVALERGTPLAEVLRAQAQDVRDLSRRRLLEVGGRKEIAMLIPVVFLVLPVTVLFAVFPGVVALEL